jgi:hypothetical protein
MTTEILQDFFERNEFNVHPYESSNGVQCAEVEMWTDGGVNMIINLNPFNKHKFIEYAEKYFDIDDEIDIHRKMDTYKRDFTITESLKDFTKYHKYIKSVANKLKKLK